MIKKKVTKEENKEKEKERSDNPTLFFFLIQNLSLGIRQAGMEEIFKFFLPES